MDHQGKCFPKHRKSCVFQPVGEKRVMASTTQKSFSLVSKQIIVVAFGWEVKHKHWVSKHCQGSSLRHRIIYEGDILCLSFLSDLSEIDPLQIFLIHFSLFYPHVIH